MRHDSKAVAVVLLVGLGVLSAVPAGATDALRRGAGPAGEVHVDVGDFYFAPATPDVRRGQTVVFDFVGNVTHTATDSSGLELFDSGNVPPGGPSTSYTYVAAGIYSFVCTPHAGMGGRVSVPVRAAPSTGGPGTTFFVVWASAAAAGDHVYDVQIKRPGQPWAMWLRGVATRAVSFDPAAHGRFRFRARLRDTGLAEASRWSEAVSIHAGR